MSRLVFALLTVCLLASEPVLARMYQWVEPGSGAVRLSGNPPPWYRNGQGGPRTLVYDDGHLVDDTAIVLPRDQEEALRSAAFKAVDLKQGAEAVKKLERAARREAMLREEKSAAPSKPTEPQAPGANAVSEQAPPETDTPENLDAESVERMKQLISEWDKQKKAGTTSP